ncbi:RNase A-like domain-containing protein [Streptomyces sp. Y2F8-2]|uniref:RNase A-like domain-containing protein n=1 Tax=Streptomyces sp. Y2F8-2 TaxID=2759675 RepID=UPI001905CFD4|nr:RNase A-like domain-containing protein [Streptomyces sp. Y2F8-2]
MWWPDADEDGLRDAARAWRSFADDVEDITAAANKAARGLIEDNKGESIDAFDAFWRRYYDGGRGWLKDLADAARDMAKALDSYADAVHGAKKHLEHELEIVGATLVAGTALAVFTAGMSEGAAVAAAAGVTELAASLGVAVTEEVAAIAGTTLATAAFGGVESITVDLAVAQPTAMALGEQTTGINLDEARQAGVYGALLGGALGGGGSAVRAARDAGGWTELLGGVRMPSFGPELAVPGGTPTSLEDLGLLIKGDGEPNAWPRSKRKGRVNPRYRADLAGDEGKGTPKSHSHTLERHVEKTDEELRARLRKDKKISGSSSFVSPEAAQDLTDRAMIERQHDVRRWLENTKKSELELEVDFGDEVTGRRLSREDFIRGTGPHDVHKVFLLLRRDPNMPSGYRIHTSYPKA